MLKNPYPNNPYCKRAADSPMRKWCQCLNCMRYEQEMKKPPQNLTRVRLLDNTRAGTIRDRLSKQYTVDYDDGSFGFLMKEDQGDVWEFEELTIKR